MNLLDSPLAIQYGGKPLEQGSVKGDIRFAEVRFAYDVQSGQPALDGFDLHIPAGKTVALVGATGGGKSTITKLLLRFYDPQQG